jgi:hypothetical protein
MGLMKLTRDGVDAAGQRFRPYGAEGGWPQVFAACNVMSTRVRVQSGTPAGVQWDY